MIGTMEELIGTIEVAIGSALLKWQLALLCASSNFVFLPVLDSFLGIFLDRELYLEVF